MLDDECIDDPAIADAEILWRAIHPTQLIRDKLSGRIKPTSGAYRDQTGRMSVDIASMTSLPDSQARSPGKFISQFAAQLVRKAGKCVTQKLDPDPNNPAHAVVCPKLSVAEARVLAELPDAWIAPPPDDALPPLPPP